MNKQLYIMHGYNALSTDHWYPWLENTMQIDGFITQAISFPNSSQPKVKDWLNYLDENIPVVDENTFLVAHSLGCITTLRYLQQIRKPAKVGGYILVSGFCDLMPNIKTIPAFADLDPTTENDLYEFANFSPDYAYLSGITSNRAVIAAEDDYIIPFDANLSQNLAKNLNAEFYNIQKGGHFLADDGFQVFPLVADLLQKMADKNSEK